jgi:O-antigen/teichoic acid export membrane protein
MKILNLAIVRGAGWTAGTFGASQLLRLVTNVVLARLLAPELFGIMVIVNSVRTGVDLISNVGIGQNIVHNRNAEQPDFYNTAWSLGLIRGFLLWIACVAAAVPLAHFYESPILAWVLPVAGLFFVLGGMSSLSEYILLRRLQIAKVNVFQLLVEVISAGAHVIFSYLSPTVWALVFGGLSASVARTIGSYFLLRDLRHRFHMSNQYTRQIIVFGKWIFLSSVVYFFSMNFDRLFLGKNTPLELLGIYGIARSLSDMLVVLSQRIGGVVIFPLIASSDAARADLRGQLASIRMKFLLAAALGLSVFAATADVMIMILYDQRYHAAGWMLAVLIVGSWFSVICSINEAILLGLGKPSYGATANALKLGWLLVGLPVAFAAYGILGAVTVVAIADVSRYFPILFGQIRERFSFGVQDLITTLVVFGLIGLWEWLRWGFGFGTSFDGLRIASEM